MRITLGLAFAVLLSTSAFAQNVPSSYEAASFDVNQTNFNFASVRGAGNYVSHVYIAAKQECRAGDYPLTDLQARRDARICMATFLDSACKDSLFASAAEKVGRASCESLTASTGGPRLTFVDFVP